MLFIPTTIVLAHMMMLVGTGGAGNSALCRTLARQSLIFNNCDNADDLKHAVSPLTDAVRVSGADKAIFVFSDILRSIYSHYRRGWPLAHFANFHPPMLFANYSDLVRETTRAGEDLTGVCAQILNWKQLSPFPVLFIDFAEDFESEIRDFVGANNTVLPVVNKRRLEKHSSAIESKTTPEMVSFYKRTYLRLKCLHGKVFSHGVERAARLKTRPV
jgi:hypothetical protein